MLLLGILSKNILPYLLLTTRLSAKTTYPLSSAFLIKRPTACLVSITQAGKLYCIQALSLRSLRSRLKGSSIRAKGSLEITTPLSVLPGASKPSQKLFNAKSESFSSAKNSSFTPLTDKPHFCIKTRRLCGFMSSRTVS